MGGWGRWLWVGILAGLIFLGALGSLGDTVVEGQLAHDRPVAPLEGGRVVVQTFVVAAEGLAALDLLLANYGQVSEGELVVELVGPLGEGVEDAGETDAVLRRWRVDATSVADNRWRRFALPGGLDVKIGERLALRLRRDSPGRPLTVWASTGDAWPDGQVFVDGLEQAGDLTMRLRYATGRWRAIQHALDRAGWSLGPGLGLLFGLALAAAWMLARGLSGG